MRRRHQGSNIYQVDLIAALFAGYTILWLVTADKTEILREPTELTLATMQISIDGKDWGGRDYRQYAIPLAARETSCVPDSLEEFIDSGVVHVAFCTTTSKVRPTNNYNDAYSVLEPDGMNEACRSNLKTRPPVPPKTVLEASMVDLDLPAGMTLLGVAYSHSALWPFAPLPPRSDTFPQYIGINQIENSTPSGPAFACAYDLDRNRNFQVIFALRDANSLPRKFSVKIVSARGGDVYHVYRPASIAAEAFVTNKDIPTLKPNGLNIHQDWTLSNPEISIRLCVHDNGSSVGCWSGSEVLKKGVVVMLDQEL